MVDVAEETQRAWLDAIQEALQVLHFPSGAINHTARSSSTTSGNRDRSFQKTPSSQAQRHERDVDSNKNPWELSLNYLSVLEALLLEQHSSIPAESTSASLSDQLQAEDKEEKQLTLDDPPTSLPPKFDNIRHKWNDDDGSDKNKSSNNNGNVYDQFYDQDDDDDEAGDEVLLTPFSLASSNAAQNSTRSTTMQPNHCYTARRLLVRIHTGQAELFVGCGRYLETQQRQNHQHQEFESNARSNDRQPGKIALWTRVAQLAAFAFDKGKAGLMLADAAVSQWFQKQEENLMEQQKWLHEQLSQNQTSPAQPPPSPQQPSMYHHAALVQDAEIVDVAIQHLVQYKERLEHDIGRERNRLENRLRPQWETRDQVKQRLGQQYWYNNPAPKLDHARLRQAEESDLKEVDALLQQMQRLGIDTLVQSAVQLRERLDQYKADENSNQFALQLLQMQQQQEQEQQQLRHNGIRLPEPAMTNIRVSRQDYPDPNVLKDGWVFTGSDSAAHVEYYEFCLLSPSTLVAPRNGSSNNTNTTNNNDDQPNAIRRRNHASSVNARHDGAPLAFVQLDWYYRTATIQTFLYYPNQQQQRGGAGTRIPLILEGTRVTPAFYREIILNPRTQNSASNDDNIDTGEQVDPSTASLLVARGNAQVNDDPTNTNNSNNPNYHQRGDKGGCRQNRRRGRGGRGRGRGRNQPRSDINNQSNNSSRRNEQGRGGDRSNRSSD
ncbi:hypothetical protein ACA910_016050 [Epithemia clementina (nom. ined.)]